MAEETPERQSKTGGFPSVREIIELGPSMIGILAALFIAMSIVYEYGFFYRIEPSFFLLLTVSDHLSSFIFDFPFIVFLIFGFVTGSIIGAASVAFLSRSRHFRIPDSVVNETNIHERKKNFLVYRKRIMHFMLFPLLFVTIASTLPMIYYKPFMFISLMAFSLTIASIIYCIYASLQRKSRFILIGCGFMIFFLSNATMLCLGYAYADNVLASDSNFLKISLEGKPEIIFAKPLRYTSNYLIAYSKSSNAAFAVPIETITRIESLNY